MNLIHKLQPQIEKIKTISHRLGFEMSCDLEAANLCAIVARGCHGNWLELGTGTGLSTLFLAEVLEAGQLDTVDVNEEYSKAAQSVIGPKQGLQFIVEDGGDFLSSCKPQAYNFVFADAWPGKYSHLHLVLNTLVVGGLYFIDDLLPQSNWPNHHQLKVDALLSFFNQLDSFAISHLHWGSSCAVITKLKEDTFATELTAREDYKFLFSEETF